MIVSEIFKEEQYFQAFSTNLAVLCAFLIVNYDLSLNLIHIFVKTSPNLRHDAKNNPDFTTNIQKTTLTIIHFHLLNLPFYLVHRIERELDKLVISGKTSLKS